MRLGTDDGFEIWLGYGMNVHPGGDAESFLRALDETVLPLRERLGVTGPFGLAVRFHAEAVESLLADDALREAIGDRLRRDALVPFTGNAFVMGAFHGRPLKDQVYRPAWSDPARVAYTLRFAELLSTWCGAEREVSLSTAPGSWRGWRTEPDEPMRIATRLAETARGLRRLHEQTGVAVRLGLEPEPRCSIETTAEARAFFAGPLARALEDDPSLLGYLGVCYDVCHQAVMHEDTAAAVSELHAAGVPIVKLQASNALEVSDPSDPEARAALSAFDEPVYLHQVAAPDADGTVHVAQDLAAVLGDPSGLWAQRRPWRVHFHVPVDRGAHPPLGSTRAALDAALVAVAGERCTNHVEIETYTWEVLPVSEWPTRRVGNRPTDNASDLVDALHREYRHVLGVLGAQGFVPV